MAVLVKESFNDIDFCLDPSLALYVPLYHRDGASFMSRDHYGHTCTVTGALWTLQGRKFDGTDDDVDCGTSSVLDITGDITICIWFKITVLNSHCLLKRIGTFGTDGYSLYYSIVGNYWFQGSTQAKRIIGSSTLVINTWYCLGAVQEGATTKKLFLNGNINGVKTDSDAVVSPGSQSLYLGENIPGNLLHLNGLVGEVVVYNGAKTFLEYLRYYLATKWRYR